MEFLLLLILTVFTVVKGDCCRGTPLACQKKSIAISECLAAKCHWTCWFDPIVEYTISPKIFKTKPVDVNLKPQLKAIHAKTSKITKKRELAIERTHSFSQSITTTELQDFESITGPSVVKDEGMHVFGADGKVVDVKFDPSAVQYFEHLKRSKRRLAFTQVDDATDVPYKNIGMIWTEMWTPWKHFAVDADEHPWQAAINWWYKMFQKESPTKDKPKSQQELIHFIVTQLNDGVTMGESGTDFMNDLTHGYYNFGARYRETWSEEMIKRVPGKFNDGWYAQGHGSATIIKQFKDEESDAWFVVALTAGHNIWSKYPNVPKEKAPNQNFYFTHINDDNPRINPKDSAQLTPDNFDRAWLPYFYQKHKKHGSDWGIVRWKVDDKITAFEDSVPFDTTYESPIKSMVVGFRRRDYGNKMMQNLNMQWKRKGYILYETADPDKAFKPGFSGAALFSTSDTAGTVPASIIGVHVGTTDDETKAVCVRLTPYDIIMIQRILRRHWDCKHDVPLRAENININPIYYPRGYHGGDNNIIFIIVASIVLILLFLCTNVASCILSSLMTYLYANYGTNKKNRYQLEYPQV